MTLFNPAEIRWWKVICYNQSTLSIGIIEISVCSNVQIQREKLNRLQFVYILSSKTRACTLYKRGANYMRLDREEIARRAEIDVRNLSEREMLARCQTRLASRFRLFCEAYRDRSADLRA